MEFNITIGLEVHVQLKTATKIFCGCKYFFGATPNTLVCPVCLGLPGALPVLNKKAVDLAIKIALSLGAQIQERSVFARKNYFYPDLPKGYQISQFEYPLAIGGELPLTDNPKKKIRIKRLHLEEDAGKLLHELPGGIKSSDSLVDFNRCGVPLVEIVTEPDISSPQEANDFLQTLHQMLIYTQTSEASLEKGSLRCDANVSISPSHSSKLGVKTEIKNLNSFKFLQKALEYEIDRQVEVIRSGGQVIQETRRFDARTGKTYPMRTKEEAHDYRYFPEPDLPPLEITNQRIKEIAMTLPELPWQKRTRFVNHYSMTYNDAVILTSFRELAIYCENVLRKAGKIEHKKIVNWLKTEFIKELRNYKDFKYAPSEANLVKLLQLIETGRISHTAAKEIFEKMWGNNTKDPEQLAKEMKLLQIKDTTTIEEWVNEVISSYPQQIEDYRKGKKKIIGFLIGKVMKLSGGQADPRLVRELLSKKLNSN